jgi:hypothetical protein
MLAVWQKEEAQDDVIVVLRRSPAEPVIVPTRSYRLSSYLAGRRVIGSRQKNSVARGQAVTWCFRRSRPSHHPAVFWRQTNSNETFPHYRC